MSGPVPCPSCGQPVPLGRLACPSCGALVAAVSRAESAPAAGPDPGVDVEDGGPSAEADVWSPDPVVEPPSAPAVSTAAAEPDVAFVATDAQVQLPEAPATEPLWSAEATASVTPAPAWPSPVPGALADGGARTPAVPGSYLPPSTVHRPGAAAPGASTPSVAGGPPTWAPSASSVPPAATAGWIPPAPGAVGSAGAGMAAGGSAAGPATGQVAAAASPREGRPTVPGRASILADLPFDAPDELEGWLIALGGGLGIIGFLLPWTASLGSGLEGYFGSWGLGNLSHLPLFAFLVIVTALAVLPNRVATWVRSGVCGMVGGGILFGVVWLYLGSDASQLGALLSAVAAVLLIAGGIIAVAPGRTARSHENA
ncbi:MAG: hypothetical protein EPO36_04995 [Chloroflexota bacterium]|nr:MAG: hypothetical protein EPO36_04995 [Chloroflexota bacterium]